jgi:YYY domain-containing protein
MSAFILWYLAVTVLGWLTFPLVYFLFPGLSDRGYSLARTVGMLIWGYLFWMLATFGIAQNDQGGLMLAGLILIAVNVWVAKERLSELRSWLQQHIRMLLVLESMFLLAFAAMAILRAANPEILGTEKPMELAFINSILRSPVFPPRDPWLSGYAISYYYFGYVMTAMLARLTGVAGSVAFNLMLALVFALGACGAYGIIYNLLAAMQKPERQVSRKALLSLPILGPLFLLVVGNVEGFLEILHRKGLFWKTSADGILSSNFWTWLDIKDLSLAPVQPLAWMPDRYLWWWRASRVVQDTTLQNAPQELIDEFPFFSFLLGDLHPHVLAIPFGLLAIAVGLNLFVGGWRGQTRILGYSIKIRWQGLLFPAMVLGGLAFLNTWDILVGAALVCGAFLLQRLVEEGWAWKRLEETVIFALLVGTGSLLMYFPFYLGFSSQAGGLLPNLVNPTRGAQLWVMFATVLVPVFAFLAYLIFDRKLKAHWKSALAVIAGLILALWSLTWLASWLVYVRSPEVASIFMQSQGVSALADLFQLATQRRLAYIGGLLTLGILLVSTLALFLGHLVGKKDQPSDPDNETGEIVQSSRMANDPIPFVLMLVLLGGLLVLAPDFVFLRDQFGWRINTIFKFYYQAWMFWSLVAALGTAILIINLRGVWDWLYRFSVIVILLIGFTYPVLGVLTKTNDFKPYFGWSLDGAGYMERDNPDEALAINWLKTAPDGVVLEAVGGSYTNFGRVSTLTGLPTILGWPGHEAQWRGSYDPQANREEDVRILYETSNWSDAEMILEKYKIRYIYIGTLERSTYRVNEIKFQRLLQPVYSQGSVVIYATP